MKTPTRKHSRSFGLHHSNFQKRAPEGHPAGGQWVDEGKVANEARKAAGLQEEDPMVNQQRMIELFNKRKELDQAQEEAKRLRKYYESARRDVYKNSDRRDWHQKMADGYWRQLSEQEKTNADLTRQLKELEKSVSPLGFKEWVKVPKESKSIGGGWSYYSHPQFGEIGVYRFGGWSMQRVAANYAVEYGGGRFEWSGAKGEQRLRNFLAKHFGIS